MLLSSMGYSSENISNLDLKQFKAPPPPSHVPAPITRLAKEISAQSADLPLSKYPKYDEIFHVDPVTYDQIPISNDGMGSITNDANNSKKSSGLNTVSKSDLAKMLDEQRQLAVKHTVDIIGKAASDGVVWSPNNNSSSSNSQQNTNNRSVVQELRSFRD